MQVYSIDTGYFKLDGGAMFGVVPKTIWQKLNPADENNLCSWAMRSMLIVEDNRRILVDTGMGNKQSEKFFGHYHPHGKGNLMGSLAALGFKAEDITDVILTHLHFDHCGGAVVEKEGHFKTAFRNAIYWSNEAHWKWANEPNAREKASFLKENILPIQESGQLRFIEEKKGERTRFSDAIQIQFVQGHTRSMMLPFVRYNERTIAYMADLIPSAAHIPLPYVMAYDMYPMITLEEKTTYLAEAVRDKHILFFEHDPSICCCTVEQTERGYKMGEAVDWQNL
jgi:glyoxylase-like metal-dependent hydrolase (beta-lactamase superfamily II)